MDVAALLIGAGADIEATTGMIYSLYWFATPLMVAAHWGHTNVAELLISAGADVNAREKKAHDAWAVLHFAADRGHAGVAELLIARGADINATTYHWLNTPLFMAARNGHKAVAENLSTHVSSTTIKCYA